MGQSDYPEAVQACLAVIRHPQVDPALRGRALLQMGNALSNMREHDAAARCYRMLHDQAPDDLNAALTAAHCSSWSCDWPALSQDFARVQACIGRIAATGTVAGPFSPFSLLTLTDDPQVMRWAAEQAFRQKRRALPPGLPGPGAAASMAPCPRPGGRLRLGLLSGDLHQHATSVLIIEAIETLAGGAFDLYFYSHGRDDGSALRARLRQVATVWREVGDDDPARIAARMRDDRLAILLEMKGYTQGSRMMVTAWRPAPIQVAWLGYPGTTGADCIDYVIGDPVVTPLDAQGDYTECIAQMPCCYQPNDSGRLRPAPLSRADCDLPQDRVVLGSFNMPYKIVPEVFAAWCRILQQVPQAVLWLLADQPVVQARLRQAAAQAGVAPERLVFAPFQPDEVHRARLPNVDLFLDCFPCSGHTTASDALWAGVPVLTLQGRSFASRVAASLLRALGLDGLVCDDIERYGAEAVRLARDRAALQALRAQLAVAREASPLFDGRRYARDFERLLLRMVACRDAGQPPAPLAAETAAPGVSADEAADPGRIRPA
jgi:predicted O-linked N-acetylglucosamine transferase (SPINDLY family)